MMLPTEQVGSIPRPAALIQGVQGCQLGRISQPELDALYEYNAATRAQRLGIPSVELSMKVSLKMEMRSETTVYRPLWVDNSHFVHSLYQGDNPGVGSSKPCLLACLVRSRCADRLKRNNGWSRSSGCDACHLGTGCNNDADSLTDERHSRRVYWS